MVQIAFSILLLAIGVHLLIKVKEAGITGIVKGLAWLVVLLSIGFMLCGIARARMHHREGHMHEWAMHGHCGMRGGCPMMGHGECNMGMSNSCCAEKMECCKKDSGAAMPACCTKGGEEPKACCKKDGAEPKACCKKGMSADSTAKK